MTNPQLNALNLDQLTEADTLAWLQVQNKAAELLQAQREWEAVHEAFFERLEQAHPTLKALCKNK